MPLPHTLTPYPRNKAGEFAFGGVRLFPVEEWARCEPYNEEFIASGGRWETNEHSNRLFDMIFERAEFFGDYERCSAMVRIMDILNTGASSTTQPYIPWKSGRVPTSWTDAVNAAVDAARDEIISQCQNTVEAASKVSTLIPWALSPVMRSLIKETEDRKSVV